MIYWYKDLYMDDTVAKHPKRCKERVERRRPWKRSYVAISLANNPDNLFEIMETRQMFFRRYASIDMYVVALCSTYAEAVDILQHILVTGYSLDPDFSPRTYFDKSDFVPSS